MSDDLSCLQGPLALKCARVFPCPLCLLYVHIKYKQKKTLLSKSVFPFEFFELIVCVSYLVTCALKLYFTGDVSCLLGLRSELPGAARPLMIKELALIFTQHVSLCFV